MRTLGQSLHQILEECWLGFWKASLKTWTSNLQNDAVKTAAPENKKRNETVQS